MLPLIALACSSGSRTAGVRREPGLNVLLITIDTLRADSVGAYGNTRVATPMLDRLSAGGVRFAHARAHNVITLPSHVNIFTGQYPFHHGVRENSGFRVPAELATLATEKWALAWRRIVVRSDDGSMIGVYVPSSPGFPWGFVLPLGAGMLVVVLGATLWYSRRLVRPLDTLAGAARRFGEGDIAARARLHRDDELGDVLDRLVAEIDVRRAAISIPSITWVADRYLEVLHLDVDT